MTFSADQKKQCIELLENYVKAAISYENNIAYHLKEGTAVDTDDEDSIHDFLNEYGSLFDDEYEQLKDIFIRHWEDDGVVMSFDPHSPGYQCPVEFGRANYSDLSSLMSEIRELISSLADCKVEYNNAEEAGVLTGDEASDRFSDLLYSYGLDYSLYGELSSVEWVEAGS